MQIDASTRVIYHNPAIQAARVMATYASASGGWWDNNGAISGCIGAWQAKGAASLAASYTDLSGNGNTLAEGTAPAFNASTGWEFTGTQHLLIPVAVTNATATAGTVILRYVDSVGLTGTQRIMDSTQGTAAGWEFILGGTVAIQTTVIKSMTFTSAIATIVLAATYDGAAIELYKDGSLVDSDTQTGNTTPVTQGKLGNQINNAAPLGSGNYLQAAAFYSTDIGPTAVGTITTAMAAL